MIEIKPQIQHESKDHTSGTILQPAKILWQGMHICVEFKPNGSGSEIIDLFRVGHGCNTSLQVTQPNGWENLY